LFVLKAVAFRKLYSGQGYKRDEPDEEAGHLVELISGGCGHEGIEMAVLGRKLGRLVTRMQMINPKITHL
jgi:hypothetical protein